MQLRKPIRRLSWSLAALLLLLGQVALAQEHQEVGAVVEQIEAEAGTLLTQYAPANGLQTGAAFSRLYFDVFEASGMELEIGLLSQGLMQRTEADFGALIGLCMQGRSKTEVVAAWQFLEADLEQARTLHAGRSDSWVGQFAQSFVILLREGLEAMLVLSALALYLRRSGNGDRVATIWWGGALAVLASIAVAWLLSEALSLSGVYRERIEGGVMLGAALLMLYVSGWLLRRRNIDWKAQLMSQADSALSGGGLLALGLTAFLAVFREGAETILFYQALMADGTSQTIPLLAGIAVAALVLLALYWVMRSFSFRIPLKAFFTVTAAFLLVMSLSFVGKGVLELQMGGLLPKTALESGPSLPWVGVFPIREPLLAQALIVLLALLLPLLWRRPNRAAGTAE